MKLSYLTANDAWIFREGTEVVTLEGFPRSFRAKKEAIAAARERGLTVDSKGNVAVAGNKEAFKKALQQLSIDGRAKLPTGHTVEVLVGPAENKAGSVGIIRLIDPDGTVTDSEARSIQGVHLEAKEKEVLRMILGNVG